MACRLVQSRKFFPLQRSGFDRLGNVGLKVPTIEKDTVEMSQRLWQEIYRVALWTKVIVIVVAEELRIETADLSEAKSTTRNQLPARK